MFESNLILIEFVHNQLLIIRQEFTCKYLATIDNLQQCKLLHDDAPLLPSNRSRRKLPPMVILPPPLRDRSSVVCSARIDSLNLKVHH